MSRKQDDLLIELREHYDTSRVDNDTRQTRHNGWDDVTREYHGYLPSDWPYLSMVTDPVVRTILQEKNARLFNNKLKGIVVPRENGDILKAVIHNAILDYQWDAANVGGGMLEKWALMDMQARMFGASFGLSYWNTETDEEGKVIVNGNEFKVLDNRDVFVDYTANHIRNANWVMVREFKTMEQLEAENEFSPYPIYKGLNELRRRISDKDFQGDIRSNLYISALKSIKELEDRVGTDGSFPTIEIVTEYRRDRWITFVPRYGIIIRDIPNPYKHNKVPITQLRYYPNGDDVYGDSEVEPIISLSRALNAVHCAYLDAMNLSMNPPIKVANSHEVRMDTLIYGPNALWLIGNNPNNVSEHITGEQAIANYRTAVPGLRMAIMNAMGESSQGVSSFDFKESEKTATEILDVAKQRQSRDQQNQMYLTEGLKDQMMLWLANNQQFLFDDPDKEVEVFRIVGRDMVEQLRGMGMSDVDLPYESATAIQDMMEARRGDVGDAELGLLAEQTSMPSHPVILNPEEKDLEKLDVRPKLELDENGESARLYITKDDMAANMYFDYIPDVKSMAVGIKNEQSAGRARMLEVMLNPTINQMLMQEGKRLKISEFVLKIMQDDGEPNPEKYIEEIQNGQLEQQQAQGGQPGGALGKPLFTGDANLQAGGGLNATNQARGLVAGGNFAGGAGAGPVSRP